MALSGAQSNSNASTRTVRQVRRVKAGRQPFVPHGLLPLLGLIATLLIGMMPFATNSIENPTERAARTALLDAGVGWARVDVSGQVVTLSGAPPSAEAASKAILAVQTARAPTLLGRHRPVTKVVDKFSYPKTATNPALPDLSIGSTATAPDAAAPSLDWMFSLIDGELALSGQVPNSDVRDALLEAAGESLDPPRVQTVKDGLIVTDTSEKPGFSEIATRGLNGLSRCHSGETRFEDDTFTFVCEVDDISSSDAIETFMNAPLPYGAVGEVQVLARDAVLTCERDLSELLAESRIEFALSSATIRASSQTVLDQIAQIARNCPGRLRIEGHTDNTGRATYNDTLSQNRAEAVRSALIARGVDEDRLIAQGFGSSDPVATNSNEAGRARNRRIEIKVVRTTQ